MLHISNTKLIKLEDLIKKVSQELDIHIALSIHILCTNKPDICTHFRLRIGGFESVMLESIEDVIIALNNSHNLFILRTKRPKSKMMESQIIVQDENATDKLPM